MKMQKKNKKKNKLKKKNILLLIVFLLLIISGSVILLKPNPNKAVDTSAKNVVYTIEEGEYPTDVSKQLKEQGLIRSEKYMNELFIKNNGNIYANSYEISASMTSEEIYKIISQNKSNVNPKNTILIYEGETLKQIADKVSTTLNMTAEEVIDYWDAKSTLKELNQKYKIIDDSINDSNLIHPLEGYLYPATYVVEDNETLESLTTKILDTAEEQYAPYLNKKNPGNYNLHQALALASIIERETMTDEDKVKVAGVFYNRLNNDMPLQSDITVLYAKNEHKELVTYDDLEYDSPYNTYQNKGLPPGAISSVSLKALDAVYNPDNNDYFYFFAKQDTGEVLYSKTLKEHEEISEKYAWE